MIPKEFTNAPSIEQGEITVIGANRYGESVVIHMGNNEWVIIDSCVNPNDKDTPLPLAYLQTIGVDPDKIKLVICTHWHDDHIIGLSRILKSAINAEFCIARASDREKFLAFIAMNAEKTLNSSTQEFAKCFQILIDRNRYYKEAIEDRPIYTKDDVSIICLSPSDYTLQNFDLEIQELFLSYGSPTKRLPYDSPNSRSIATFIKLGNHRAILGADLEVGKNPQSGWLKVLKNITTIDRKSSLLKISHHGSENGYHPDIWSDLLVVNPVAKITPWSLGGMYLPREHMIDTYKKHTSNLYITEHVISKKQKVRDGQLEKVIKQLRPNIYEIKYRLGIIRSRILINDDTCDWQVENLVAAKKIA